MHLLLRSIVRRSTVNFLPYWETCSSERCSPGLSTASLAGIAGERRECSHAGTTDFALRGFDGRHERVVLESGVLVRCRWLRRAHRGSQPHSPGAALCCEDPLQDQDRAWPVYSQSHLGRPGHASARTRRGLHFSDAELPCSGADWGYRARSGRSRRTDPRSASRSPCVYVQGGGGSCPGWRGAHQSAVCCEQPTLTLARRLRLRVVEGHLTAAYPHRRTEPSQHHSLATACLALECRCSDPRRSSS